MAKRKSETIEILYGINRKTFKVEMVFVRSDGTLSNLGALQSSHFMMPNHRAEDEARLVWGLTDIISIPAGSTDSEFSKSQIAALHEKADAMKQEASPG